MTIENDTFRTTWLAANGINKDWSYEFRLDIQSHVRIEIRDAAGDITLHDANLALFKTDETEGYVRFPVTGPALTTGNHVRVSRLVPYTQEIEIGAEGTFNPELHETAFDNLAMQIQQLKDLTDRAAILPIDSDVTILELVANILALGKRVTELVTVSGIAPQVVIVSGITANLATVVANLTEILAVSAKAAQVTINTNQVQTNTNTVAVDKGIVAADKAIVAADKGIVLGYRTDVEGYRVEVSANKTIVQNDKVTATLAADTAVTARVATETARDQVLAAYDQFDDRYLGAKAVAPTVDNDGDPLIGGALYFDTIGQAMMIWTGAAWVAAYVSGSGFAALALNGSDYHPATFRTNLDLYSTGQLYTRTELDTALGAKADAAAMATALAGKEPADPDILKANEDEVIHAGFTAGAISDGNTSSGAYKPQPVGGNFRILSNTAAFNFAAPDFAGAYTMIVQVTNSATAGVLTLTGFTSTNGDPFTTTNGHKFFVFITRLNGFTLATVKALQ